MARIGFLSLLVGLATCAASVSGTLPLVDTLVKPTTVLFNFGGNTATLASIPPPTRWRSETQRTQDIEAMNEKLKLVAAEAQGPAIDLLKALVGVKLTVLWITNQLLVEDCPVAIIPTILDLADCTGMIKDFSFDMFKPEVSSTSQNSTGGESWGTTHIHADDAWTTNIQGDGVRVGSIDTGALASHKVLTDNFLGAHGWFDPAGSESEPYDDNGHGTHTLATIVGSNGVGVAPKARWLSCKGCGPDRCTLSSLISCAQFMLAPTLPDGSNADASLAPHIVSNSWGVGKGLTYFQQCLDAWTTAGIIPVFATGNYGRDGCTTAMSPGDAYNAIAVGATDVNNNLAVFSSRGPSVNGRLKPEVIAPGVDVLSAWNSGDEDYRTLSGTSMATPMVSGTIALLLSARPGLTFDDILQVMSNTTEKMLPPVSENCGGTPSTSFPNNEYGLGLINAFTACDAAMKA